MVRRWRMVVKAEVTSSNTVGYQKLSTVAGLNLLGVQFQTVGGTGSNLSENMALSGLVGFDWSEFAGGDQMYVWDKTAQGYSTIYTYAGDSVPADITTALGYDLSGKWMDASMLPVTEPIALGEGLWVDSTASEEATIVVSGEVNTNAVTKTIVSGLNLIANPYPKAFDVNSATYTGLVGFDWSEFAGGDQMYVWNKTAQGYSTIYTYAGDSVPADITTALGYDLSGKWMDASMLPVSEPIPVGEAVWIDTSTESSSASVSFTY